MRHSAKIPFLTIAVSLVVAVLYFVAPFGGDVFQALLASKTDDFRWYTLLTAQLIHTDFSHFSYDLLAFVVLSYCVEMSSIRYWCVTAAASFTAIAVWFVLQNQFQHYAGLSGALNGFFVVTLYCLLDVDKSKIQSTLWNGLVLLLLIGVVIKNSYELYFDVALFSDTRWRSTPSFHMVGMLVGFVLVGAFHGIERIKKSAG